MSDIVKCEGTDCPLKQTCYRYLSTSNSYMQSYFITIPYNKEKNKCDLYWDFGNYDNNKKLNKNKN